MRRMLLMVVGWAIFLGAGCDGGVVRATADPISEAATISVVQATVDSLKAGSLQTAQAWMTAAPTAAQSQAETTAADLPASISGELDYPGDELPPMRVVAINIETNEFYSVEVKDTLYQIEGLPPGNYQVMVYLMKAPGFEEGKAGGYTQAVLCGLGVGCNDHELVILELEAGESAKDVNPIDWNLAENSFPPDPIQ